MPRDSFDLERRGASWAARVAYPQLLRLYQIEQVDRAKNQHYDVLARVGPNKELRIEEKALRQDGRLFIEILQSMDPREYRTGGWWQHGIDALLYMLGWENGAEEPASAYWIDDWQKLRRWLCDSARKDPRLWSKHLWIVSKGFGLTIGIWVPPTSCPRLIKQIWPRDGRAKR